MLRLRQSRREMTLPNELHGIPLASGLIADWLLNEKTLGTSPCVITMYQRASNAVPHILLLPCLLSDRLPEGTDGVPIFIPANLRWVRPSGQATLLPKRQVVTVTPLSSLTSTWQVCPTSALVGTLTGGCCWHVFPRMSGMCLKAFYAARRSSAGWMNATYS